MLRRELTQHTRNECQNLFSTDLKNNSIICNTEHSVIILTVSFHHLQPTVQPPQPECLVSHLFYDSVTPGSEVVSKVQLFKKVWFISKNV